MTPERGDETSGRTDKTTWTVAATPALCRALPKQMVRFAEIARRDGILALEAARVEAEVSDLLNFGIQMAVDGSDPELIYDNLNRKVETIEQMETLKRDLLIDGLECLANGGSEEDLEGLVENYVPDLARAEFAAEPEIENLESATLIDLVRWMLREARMRLGGRYDRKPGRQDDVPEDFLAAGHRYLDAGLSADEIRKRLGARKRIDLHWLRTYHRILVHGVMSIQSGDNPKIVEQKLRMHLC